jgi:ABC-2 type transport system permease protein
MPMTFLGGAFYSIHMLPEPWRTITLFNPVIYLISGFRWTFFGKGDVAIGISISVVAAMLLICIAVIHWVFKTGYRLKKIRAAEAALNPLQKYAAYLSLRAA